MTALLDVRGLGVEHETDAGFRTVVSSVDLSVEAGETIAIVGESGSGKSLTARALIGLLPPRFRACGQILYRGVDLTSASSDERRALRGGEIGMVLQDPFTALNPLMTAGRHLTEMLRGPDGRSLRKVARREEAVRRLGEVGISDPDATDAYPFELSGGMRQRVGIAAALSRDPKLLIADEPTTALDVTTQAEILRLLRQLQEARGMALILITHDLRVAFATASRIYVMYGGMVVETGASSDLERRPAHPYTDGLLRSEPPADRRVAALAAIPGSVPAPDEVAGICPFAPRCPYAAARCMEDRPPLLPATGDHRSACVRIDEIADRLGGIHAMPQWTPSTNGLRAPDENVLVVECLTKEYISEGLRGAGRSHVALDDVSLHIGPGESVGLIGESGAGKTTLARCLLGLETPDAGRIALDGLDVHDRRSLSPEDRRRASAAVQMVFQDPYSSLNPALTIGRTLLESARLRPAGGPLEARVAGLLELVGLPATYADRKPSALSGGERQRVAIARALAMEPKLIVCDEPVSALDVSVQAQILNLLNELRTSLRLSFLFITHDLSVVRQVAERGYVLYRGRIVESGAIEEILDRPTDEYTQSLTRSVPERQMQ